MPASIALSDLAISAPDGRRLCSGITLSFGAERAGLVGRNGVGKTTLLSLIADRRMPHAGSVSVSGTVAMLRQKVESRTGETIADLFCASYAIAIQRRAETGAATADELLAVDWTLEGRMLAALARLGLDAPPETDLARLSGGQVTRARLAALTFAAPDFLLLDEPTNNLDHDGRASVIDLLAGWRGGAVVVSHDRELLNTMDAIVELTSLGATRYGGNWSHYRERQNLELAAVRHNLAIAEKQLAEIDRKAQDATENKARKDGRGQRKRSKGDLPRLLAGGRKDRSEDTAGETARLTERRRVQALEAASSARGRIEVLQPISVKLPSTRLPATRVVLEVTRITAGYDRENPILRDVSFSITGPERVAVVGPNGSGKTTLLKLIRGQIQPWSGLISLKVDTAMFDQSVGLLDGSASILENFRRLNSTAGENACRRALAQFMFRADAALQEVSTLSGGQLLRAGLACVLGGPSPPSLLILDEPTNHLDIEAIEALEAGLRAYDGALLIVSHDSAILEAIGVSRRVHLASQDR
jgi:ATPase subunit of ABC transporter with duplicated ATPase domains